MGVDELEHSQYFDCIPHQIHRLNYKRALSFSCGYYLCYLFPFWLAVAFDRVHLYRDGQHHSCRPLLLMQTNPCIVSMKNKKKKHTKLFQLYDFFVSRKIVSKVRFKKGSEDLPLCYHCYLKMLVGGHVALHLVHIIRFQFHSHAGNFAENVPNGKATEQQERTKYYQLFFVTFFPTQCEYKSTTYLFRCWSRILC